MKQWFLRLNQREQLSVLGLALALSLYVLFVLVWAPLAARHEQVQLRNAATAEALQRVDAMVSEVLQLREEGAGAGSRRNLSALVNQTTSEVGLALNRVQPSSRGDLQVRLEGVDFARLARWLYLLEYREGLVLEEVSIAQAGSAARVNASIRLGQGG